MAFTYNDDLTTDLDRIRFHVGDTVEGAGPKPDKGNLTDEEINALVILETTWQRAVAACYEALAALWAKKVDVALDDYREATSQTAQMYRTLAQMQRRQYGYGVTGVVSIAPIRVDGYSQDIASDEVEDSGGDYAT